MISFREAMRLFWQIVDQAIFAISNFIINVLFARWLTPTEYGMFALSFTGYLFLAVVHWGAVIEPLLVLSARIDTTRRRSYIWKLGVAHLALLAGAVIISFTALAIANFYGSPDIGWVIVGSGVGGTAILMLTTARRMCLAFLTPRFSAVIGVVYCAGVLITARVMPASDHNSWFTLWEIMATWAVLCSALIFGLLLRHTDGENTFSYRELFRFQWQYAPGAVLASICTWSSFDGVYLMLASALGVEAIAQTRAVFNIANPLNHINMAMHAAWLVLFSEKQHEGRKNNIWPIVSLYAGVMLFIVGVLAFAAPFIVRLFYAGRYEEGAWQLPWYVLTIGCVGVCAMITSFFKARGGLWQGFAPQFLSAVVALGTGAVLIHRLGQAGAVFAVLSGAATALTLALIIYCVAMPRPRAVLDLEKLRVKIGHG